MTIGPPTSSTGDLIGDRQLTIVLPLAAVCGDEFDLGTVLRAATLAEPLLERSGVVIAITQAQARGALVPVARSTTRYRFARPEQRTELLASLTPQQRMDRHRRVAEALERSGGDALTVAEHRLQAAPLDPSSAVTAGRRGAGEAARRGAHRAAIALYRSTLDAQVLLDDLDLVERADLLVSLGQEQAKDGRRDEALESFTQALTLDLPQPHRADIAGRAVTSYGEWPAQPERDTPDAGLRTLAEAALAALGDADAPVRAVTLARLGQTARWANDVGAGADLVAQAESMAARLDDPTARAVALLARRLITVAPGAGPTRDALTNAAVPATRDHSPRDLPLALFLRAADQLEAGDLGAANATTSQLLDEAERTDEPGHWWYAKRFETSLALLAGRLDRAEQLAGEAWRYGSAAQHPRARVSYEYQLLHCRAAAGGVADGLAYWQDAADTSPWHRATLAWGAAIAGQPERARTAIGDVLALGVAALPHNAGWLSLLVMTADTVVEIDLPEPVMELRALIEPYETHIATVFNGLVCHGSLQRVAGRLALAAGDLDAAERHLRTAVAANDRLGAVLLAATSRADLARALRRRSDPSAAAVLDQALNACRARGATALAERLDRSTDLPAPRVRDDRLSPREIEVLRHLAAGLTNKEIAGKLYVSPATVQRHTINVYRKIGASGRSDAAVYAARHHLLDP